MQDVGDNYLGPVKLIIPILVSIAAMGTANGNVFTAGRIAYVVGREGHMPDILSYVHSTRLTPIVALTLNVSNLFQIYLSYFYKLQKIKIEYFFHLCCRSVQRTL